MRGIMLKGLFDIRRLLGLVVGLLVAGSALSGCVHENPQSLVIIGNATAVREQAGGEAGVSGMCYPTELDTMRPTGKMDLMVANAYQFFPIVENLLRPTANISGNQPSDLRADASLITVHGAELKIRVPRTLKTEDGPYVKAPKGFATLPANPDTGVVAYEATVFEPFALGIKAGEQLISRFAAIPTAVGNALRAPWRENGQRYSMSVTAIVDMTLEGTMADGTTVQSHKMSYPVELCWGCLLAPASIGPGLVDESAAIWSHCTQKNVPIAYIPPCEVGNDEFVLCSFYCHICDIDETLNNGFGCDEQFCPAAP